MPLEPEELSPDLKLYNIIDKVVIVRGVIPSDPTVWEFYIQDKILKVDTESLEGMRTFRQQFLKVFDRPAPRIRLSRWPSVLEALAEDKAEYTQAPEESNRVFIARQMFEIVCDRDVSDIAEDAVSGLTLYQREFQEDSSVWFCMPSKVFLNYVDEAGFKIPANELSTAMCELGLKRSGTPRVRYGGPQIRSWCFSPEAVWKEKGDEK